MAVPNITATVGGEDDDFKGSYTLTNIAFQWVSGNEVKDCVWANSGGVILLYSTGTDHGGSYAQIFTPGVLHVTCFSASLWHGSFAGTHNGKSVTINISGLPSAAEINARDNETPFPVNPTPEKSSTNISVLLNRLHWEIINEPD